MRIANGVIGSITICAAVTILAPVLYAQDQKPGSTTAQASTSALTDADIGRVAFNENCAKTSCRINDFGFVTGFETPAEYDALQNAGNSARRVSCQAASIDFVSEFVNPYEETMRTASAGLSSLTGEQTNGDAAYLIAYVERPDGSGHPAFGTDEQRMFIYMMPSGKYVLRIIEDAPEKYWPGAH